MGQPAPVGGGMAAQPGMPGPASMQQPSTGRLSLIFNGRKIPITKDQFIIGRGSKTSDLPIKDGNISRKHAAIINHGGVYYIKDLGSTNGIEYNGMRIDNKRVEEGDVFHICDYEIRFTYR
jgi:pSer/pThr/pTyr-binding forkhead associated (FHA) protein